MSENVNISEVIFAALESRRMVVLPELGAFVRNREGKIIFSQLLDTDDGVLRQLAAEQSGDAMKGDALVDRFIFDVRSSLEDTGVCRIGSYGTMVVTRNGSVIFHEGVMDESPRNRTPRSVLRSDSHQDTASDGKEQQTRQKKLYYHKRRRSMDKFLIFAIVVILLSLAAMAYGLYVSRHTSQETSPAPEMITDQDE